MKNEIEKILGQIYQPWDGSNLSGVTDAADELQALMCCREVKAYYKAYDELKDEFLSWDEFTQEALGIFMEDYPESIILEAINKVKSEQQ